MDTGISHPDSTRDMATARVPTRRHHLTVVFCDLCGSTALSASMEAEDYDTLLTGLRAAYESAVARHGGTVVRLQGDGMLAIFGYPYPREGDGRRAVEAVVQLHRAVAALPVAGRHARPVELRLHSGIHAGMVLVKGGDDVLGRLELLGMAPNIAGTLSSQARRDEILVSEETLGPDRYLFETGPPRLIAVDDQNSVVPCLPVLGRASARTPFEGSARQRLQTFVGRHDEIHRLEIHLGKALAGETPRQVAIAGPPGVGKTRLAEQFLIQALWKGCRVLKGYCDGEFGGSPLQPLAHMLRSVAGVGPEATPAQVRAGLASALAELEIVALLPTLLQAMAVPPDDAAPAPAPAAPEATQAALGELFAALARRQPLLLFVDDWHWSDLATRQALSTITSTAAGLPLLLLCSTRGIDPGDATIDNVSVVELQPFSASEATASIQALLPNADPFVADEIRSYSGGNVLFIEELCHWAARHDGKRRLVKQQAGAAWLKGLIESRVALLPDDDAELLRTAAVIGNVIPAWLLHELTRRPEEDRVLRKLADMDFLYPDSDGSLRFKHGLTRDVIYESVGLHARRTLHLRVAQALRERGGAQHEPPHEALAYHFGAAGIPIQAAEHATIAGDRAAAVSALDRARAQYRAALEQLDAVKLDSAATRRWLDIANKLGLICVFDAARKDLPVFERALELAQREGDPALVARAEYWLGYILYALGDATKAIKHCERALLAGGHGDSPLAVQIRATLGQVKAAASQYDEALPLLEEAVAIKRRHRRSARPAVGLAYTLVCLASVVGDRGDFARAHEHFDDAWALLNGATHEIGASIQGWRAVVLTWQGRWDEARSAANESTRIAEATRSMFQFAQGRATAAYAGWKLTGDDHWVGVLEESTTWLEPRDSGLFRSLDHGWLTEAWFACGAVQPARRHAARALRRACAGDLIGVGTAYRALAGDAAARHDFAAARHYLAGARRIGEQRGAAHEAAVNDLCAAQIAVSADQARAARQHGEAALAGFEALRMDWHAERARTLLAQA